MDKFNCSLKSTCLAFNCAWCKNGYDYKSKFNYDKTIKLCDKRFVCINYSGDCPTCYNVSKYCIMPPNLYQSYKILISRIICNT